LISPIIGVSGDNGHRRNNCGGCGGAIFETTVGAFNMKTAISDDETKLLNMAQRDYDNAGRMQFAAESYVARSG
jgi:hypothetical protein